MGDSGLQKYWWIVLVVGCVAAVAILVSVTNVFLPDAEVAGSYVAYAVLAATFLAVYAIDTQRRWWAIIPGLGMFVFMAAMAADQLIGTDPSNDWASVGVLAIGAAIIGVVIKRKDAKMTLYLVAAGILGISILMSPLALVWKIGLCLLEVPITWYFVMRVNAGRPMVKSRGWLHPQP